MVADASTLPEEAFEDIINNSNKDGVYSDNYKCTNRKIYYKAQSVLINEFANIKNSKNKTKIDGVKKCDMYDKIIF